MFIPAVAARTFSEKVIILTDTSLTSWTVPADFGAENTIHVIGGGQAGATGGSNGTDGGDGGDYARKDNVSLTPGASITIQIGAGGAAGTGNAGESTFFNGANFSAATLGAKGGGGSDVTKGDIVFFGGPGGSAGGSDGGGGGGGAAGPDGDGGDGGDAIGSGYGYSGGGGGANGGFGGGDGRFQISGGSGGNNRNGTGGAVGTNNDGADGTDGGGGAGAGYGGAGGNGLIVIRYKS